MKPLKEAEILLAVRNADRKKKRVTFFISDMAKAALAAWCKQHDITESGAIEQMIRSTVPEKYFKER